MAAVNVKRVWIGGLVGGVVWVAWGTVLNFAVLMTKYTAASKAGLMLKAPRYSLFLPIWMLQNLFLGVLIAALYAGVRATWGPGWRTAIAVGLIVGLAAGFPVNFYLATWVPFSRSIPAGWALELVGGALLAAVVAGWLYRD